MIEMTGKTREAQEAFTDLLIQQQCEFGPPTYDPHNEFNPEFRATPDEEKLYFYIHSIGNIAADLHFTVSVGTEHLRVIRDEQQLRSFTGPDALIEAIEFTREMLTTHRSA